jgi:hypothetical protein
LLKELNDEVPSPFMLPMLIVFGYTGKGLILMVGSKEVAFFEDIRVATIIGVELDSAHLTRLHSLILAHDSLATCREHLDEFVVPLCESLGRVL